MKSAHCGPPADTTTATVAMFRHSDDSWAFTPSSAFASVATVVPFGIAVVVGVYGWGVAPSCWHCIKDQVSPSSLSYSHSAHYESCSAALRSRQANVNFGRWPIFSPSLPPVPPVDSI
jgi:hypothetical protein